MTFGKSSAEKLKINFSFHDKQISIVDKANAFQKEFIKQININNK